MIKTNMDKLVAMSVVGEITHPASGGFGVSYDGSSLVPVGMCGITFNIKVGNPAFGWAWGDHVEPGVSIKNNDVSANTGLNILSCVGNRATVISAALESPKKHIKGATGVVTGQHGGAERVLIYFKQNIIDSLCVGDKIQIKSIGVGLKFIELPDIKILNVGPELFKALPLEIKGGKLHIPVAKIVPAHIMGSGLGNTNSFRGDYDIQTTSQKAIDQYGLGDIRLGDLIGIIDHDCSFGPRYHKGAVTVGVVIHGRSVFSGHGPGVVVLFTSPKKVIEPIVARKANIADLLKLK
jgi:hypothetical protein